MVYFYFYVILHLIIPENIKFFKYILGGLFVKINKSAQDFNKVAQTNAVRTGLTKGVKKSDEEVKTECVKDQVSLNQLTDNAQHTGAMQDTAREEKSEGTEEETEKSLLNPEQQQQLSQLPAGDYLMQLVSEGKLSPEQLAKVLELDTQRRQEEMQLKQHEMTEREAMKDSWLNMWEEAAKAEKDRIKTLMTVVDYMRNADAEMLNNMIKTNRGIQAGWYAAMFG